MIGALSPAPLQGVLMGVWMLTTGVGATLSSYSSNWMTAGQDSLDATVTNASYSHVFLILGLFAIAASFVLFLLTPKLRSLMQKKSEGKVCNKPVMAAG
jgi:POT family proton-dependent oligopeptide transporter